MVWKGESKRHSRAKKYGRAGGKYRKRVSKRKRLSAPLRRRSVALPIQVSVNVPSTKFDKKISPLEFRKRVQNTAKEFSDRFGGDTAIKGKGDYTTNGKLIREDVVIVESSMTKEDYRKNKPAIEKFIKDKKREWKQESIGYSFEDTFYIYPK